MPIALILLAALASASQAASQPSPPGLSAFRDVVLQVAANYEKQPVDYYDVRPILERRFTESDWIVVADDRASGGTDSAGRTARCTLTYGGFHEAVVLACEDQIGRRLFRADALGGGVRTGAQVQSGAEVVMAKLRAARPTYDAAAAANSAVAGPGAGERPEASPGQTAPAAKPLTNADVVSMVAARLSDEVVIRAVRQAITAAFDVSPAALIALRDAGVSDRVILAMQDRPQGPRVEEPQAPPADEAKPMEPAPQIPASPAEPCRILVTQADPPAAWYVIVKKDVEVGKKWYGSHDASLMRELARKADKAGADAIIRFHEWRAPSMWSWSAAKAGGVGVRWTAEGKAKASTLEGQCWSPTAQDPQ